MGGSSYQLYVCGFLGLFFPCFILFGLLLCWLFSFHLQKLSRPPPSHPTPVPPPPAVRGKTKPVPELGRSRRWGTPPPRLPSLLHLGNHSPHSIPSLILHPLGLGRHLVYGSDIQTASLAIKWAQPRLGCMGTSLAASLKAGPPSQDRVSGQAPLHDSPSSLQMIDQFLCLFFLT